MKTAVIYYSMSGNCEYAAEWINSEIGADLIRLEPEKAYPVFNAVKGIRGRKFFKIILQG